MAKKCGLEYLILTTKHHDGFCLWDTAYTEYKTTAEDCPFHTHEYADIVRAMFDAFRKEKLGIGCIIPRRTGTVGLLGKERSILEKRQGIPPMIQKKIGSLGAVPCIYPRSDPGTWKAVWKAGYPLV